MIINLHCNDFSQNRFSYDGSYVRLDRRWAHEVAVLHIHIELKSNQVTKDNELWCLSTNLVDRSPANAYQAVSYFTLSRGKLNHDITPSVVFHPLDTYRLDNLEFFIQRITKEKTLNFEHAFIQIEIRCSESVRL